MCAKIYTRTGDKGRSMAIDGRRLAKSHLIFEVEGELDSVNSYMGLILSHKDLPPNLRSFLMDIQHHIFNIGAHFWKKEGSEFITSDKIDKLEAQIDDLSDELPPLTQFILPGGSELAAYCHMARVQCRRCERVMVRYHEEHEIDGLAIKYINRLSDFLFTLARYNNNKGQDDILWEKGRG